MDELNSRATKLAKAFADKVREWVTPSQFEEIRVRNRTYEKGICASHDFFDANMAMLEAFEETFDRAPQIHDGAPLKAHDQMLWNRAWDIAKLEYLTEGNQTQ